ARNRKNLSGAWAASASKRITYIIHVCYLTKNIPPEAGCFSIRLELVDCTGVGVEDLPAFNLGQRRLEGEARVVVIPVRIVRREQQAVDADPFDQLPQVPGFIRLVDRLGREPEMLADIFAWLALQMRHLAAEALEMLVHPPHRRRNPAEAALDVDDLQFREALGDALDHQACEVRGHGVRVRLVLLAVIGRPAAAGRRVPAIAADMDA